MHTGHDLQIYSDASSGDGSDSTDEHNTTVSYLDMLLKASSENVDGDNSGEECRFQRPLEEQNLDEGLEQNNDNETPKNNNLGFWHDAEKSFIPFEEEMGALETFLNCHHTKRLCAHGSPCRKDLKKDDEADVEDYVMYLQLNGASTNAIRQTFLYCLRTDDVKLTEHLLHDVGIEFILRHCLLYDGIFIPGSPSMSDSSFQKSHTSTANLFWLASVHGSEGVLDMLAEECLIYFIEAYTGGCEASQEVVERAKADLASLLNDDVSVCNCTPLYVAAAKNHAAVITILLKFGVNPNGTCQNNSSAAIVAASKNKLSALQALGESETIDFNWSDEDSLTPLLAACRNGCVDAVRYLVHYVGREMQQSVNCSRQNLEGYGCTSLAARYNHQEVVQFLCQIHNPDSKLGVDINQRNRYDNEIALHIAARYNCREVVRSFLEMIPCDCEVTTRNQQRMTALHIAASQGHAGIVTEFVSGAPTDLITQLDTHDSLGMTPLFHATFKGHTDCVKLLGPFSDVNRLCYVPIPRKGAPVNNVDDSNTISKKVTSSLQPPLVFASSRGYVDIVVTLLHCQADVNLPDLKGNTALIVAAEEGHLEVVELLVTQIADIKIRSKMGKIASNKARKNKHFEIVDYLEKYIPR